MSEPFVPKKLNMADVNNGNRYEEGAITVEDYNKTLEGVMQGNIDAQAATTTSEKALGIVKGISASVTENGGTIAVEVETLENEHLVFSFKNIKGDTGETGTKGDKGEKGDLGTTPEIAINAHLVEPGQQPTVTKSGTTENPIFTFAIPKGDQGIQGTQGENGAEVQLRASGGFFQWKYDTETTWQNLIAVGDISKVDQTLDTSSTNAIGNKAVATKFNEIAIDLALKADASTTYTKTETDTKLNSKADASTTYTKTETDTKLNSKADKSTTYTKTETDSKIELAIGQVLQGSF